MYSMSTSIFLVSNPFLNLTLPYSWPLLCMFNQTLKYLIISMNGPRPDKSTTSSLRKYSESLTSGKTLQRNSVSDLFVPQETQLSSFHSGKQCMEVLGHHKTTPIVTRTSLLFAVYWHSSQPVGWQCLSKTQEEHTTLTRHGQLKWEETTLQLLKLCAESHLKKDHHT